MATSNVQTRTGSFLIVIYLKAIGAGSVHAEHLEAARLHWRIETGFVNPVVKIDNTVWTRDTSTRLGRGVRKSQTIKRASHNFVNREPCKFQNNFNFREFELRIPQHVLLNCGY